MKCKFEVVRLSVVYLTSGPSSAKLSRLTHFFSEKYFFVFPSLLFFISFADLFVFSLCVMSSAWTLLLDNYWSGMITVFSSSFYDSLRLFSDRLCACQLTFRGVHVSCQPICFKIFGKSHLFFNCSFIFLLHALGLFFVSFEDDTLLVQCLEVSLHGNQPASLLMEISNL